MKRTINFEHKFFRLFLLKFLVIIKQLKYYLATCIYDLLYLKFSCKPCPDETRLFFGESIQTNQIISGGKVKLTHLQKAFKISSTEFNILYLVSSSLPVGYSSIIKAVKRRGIKVVWNQNGVGYPAWNPYEFRLFNKKLLYGYQKADYVIYQSKFCKKCCDVYLGNISTPYSILYNCVDTDIFTPATVAIPPRPLKLLLAGSHNHSYRVLIAVEVLSVLRQRGIDAGLIVAGNLNWTNAHSELAEVATRLSVQPYISFHSPYTQIEAPEIFQAAHILLHLQYNDASPTTPIEAMSCGIPVVSTTTGGTPEIIGNDGGILVDLVESLEETHFPDPHRLADAVEIIAGDLSNWSQRARKRAVEHFNKTDWIDKHKIILNM